MDVKYINPFILATNSVFKTIARIPVSSGKPYVKAGDCAGRQFPLVISIRLSGTGRGQVALRFSQSVALALASAMLEEDLKKVNQDCLDALGEVSNMITSGAKRVLPTSRPVDVSVPTVAPTHQVNDPSGLRVPYRGRRS